MRVDGRWHRFRDDVLRPVIDAAVQLPDETWQRVTFLYQTLTNIRAKARTPEEYRLYSNNYLAEIEKMNAEVLAYLKRHSSELTLTEADN